MIQGSGSEAIIAVTSAFLAIAALAVSLRCYVRVRMVHGFGWDDACMLLAMLLNIGFSACTISGAVAGMGATPEFILSSPDHFPRGMLLFWTGEIFYVLTCLTVKFSISISLLRITVQKAHVWILYAMMTASVIIAVIFLCLTIFQCSPVHYFWDRLTMRHGRCMDPSGLDGVVYLYSAVSAITDLGFGILPVFVVWGLYMPQRSKIALACILSLGCCAGIAVIIRIPFVENFKSPKFLSIATQICIWSNIESSLGITAGSLPALRPLFRALYETSVPGRSKPAGENDNSSSFLRSAKSRSRSSYRFASGMTAAQSQWRKSVRGDLCDRNPGDDHGDDYLLGATRTRIVGRSGGNGNGGRSGSRRWEGIDSEERGVPPVPMFVPEEALKIERSVRVSVTRE